MENNIAAMSNDRNANICFKKRIHARTPTSKLEIQTVFIKLPEPELTSFQLGFFLGKQ